MPLATYPRSMHTAEAHPAIHVRCPWCSTRTFVREVWVPFDDGSCLLPADEFLCRRLQAQGPPITVNHVLRRPAS
jgi:hypothetical protein